MTNNPICVLASDIHFNISTLKLASSALSQALGKAEELEIPFVIAGDLNDTKAILRAECANEIIRILKDAKVPVFVLVGNHDMINEKGDTHSLNFLAPYADIVQRPVFLQRLNAWCVPYQNDVEVLKTFLRTEAKPGQTIIMHQGIKGAYMGEYAVDKTSIEPEALAHFRVISGHYHRRQTIVTDGKKHATDHEVGTFNYIGSPYSITHAEANDGPKGYRILTAKGLDFVPTNLRKHVIVERHVTEAYLDIEGINKDDVLWLKIAGPASELEKLNKKDLGLHYIGHQSFKLDKVYDEVKADMREHETMTKEQMLDRIIDQSEETKAQKKYLKALWREVLNATA